MEVNQRSTQIEQQRGNDKMIAAAVLSTAQTKYKEKLLKQNKTIFI